MIFWKDSRNGINWENKKLEETIQEIEKKKKEIDSMLKKNYLHRNKLNQKLKEIG